MIARFSVHGFEVLVLAVDPTFTQGGLVADPGDPGKKIYLDQMSPCGYWVDPGDPGDPSKNRD
jgi:hypothetical protein